MQELTLPEIGAPCNSCGLCCRLQVCGTGAFLLKLVDKLGDRVPGPCPALTQVESGYQCGLLLEPKKWFDSPYDQGVLQEAIRFCIGAGNGCDELGENPTQKRVKAFDLYMETFVRLLHNTPGLLEILMNNRKVLFNIEG